MTSLDLIVEVLYTHEPEWQGYRIPVVENNHWWLCDCGEEFESQYTADRHRAQMILDAIGATP